LEKKKEKKRGKVGKKIKKYKKNYCNQWFRYGGIVILPHYLDIVNVMGLRIIECYCKI
jgi:hypothetical protein